MNKQKIGLNKIVIASLMILLSGCGNSGIDKDTSNSQDQTDEKIEALEKEVTDLTNKQEDAEREKKDQKLEEYKAYIFETVNDNYLMFADTILSIKSYGSDPETMKAVIGSFDTIEVIHDNLMPPPIGGEEIHQKGLEALQSMIDVRETLIVQNGQYSLSVNSNTAIVLEKVQAVTNMVTE